MRAAILCASAVLVAGCAGGLPSGQTSPSVSDSTTTSTASPSATPSSQEAALALYWVGDTAKGFRLFREFKKVAVGEDPIRTAVQTLFSSSPQDGDYTNLWPATSKVNSVRIEEGMATIDISPGKLNVGAEAEMRAIDQLVWTATAANPAIKQVKILINGKEAESLAGHVDLTEPFARGLTYEVLADIWILSPVEGQKVDNDVVVEGVATTFEANVAWRLLKGGQTVKSGATTAGEAAPARAPWTISFTDLAPGEYLITAAEYSAKDGSLVTQDTKAFTVVK